MDEYIFNNILNIFSYYYYRNIPLNNDFFIKVMDIIKNSHLKEYINRIIILDIDLNKFDSNSVINDDTSNYEKLIGMGIYDSKLREIYIRNNVIKRMLIIEKKCCKIHKKDYTIFNNLYILQVLLHEIEHANQIYLIDNGKDIESYLLRETNYYVEDSYEYRLKERLAEIKSNKYILLIIEILEIKSRMITSFFEINVFQNLRRGYEYQDPDGKNTNNYEDIFISPIEKYFYKNRKSAKKIYEISELLDDEYKVFYGLPISSSRYNELMYNIIKEKEKVYK